MEQLEACSTSCMDFEALSEILLTIVIDRRRQFDEVFVTETQSDVKKVF